MRSCFNYLTPFMIEALDSLSHIAVWFIDLTVFSSLVNTIKLSMHQDIGAVNEYDYGALI